MGLFGPSKDEIWAQLAAEVGAHFEQGTWLQVSKVVAQHCNWIVTLDTVTEQVGDAAETYTRLRAPYANRDGLRFTVYRAGLLTGVGKALGLVEDVEVGDAAFDEAFVVQSNDCARTRELLADERLRDLLMAQPRVYITVKDDEGWFGPHFPEGIDELYFHVPGVIKDMALLRGLFDLFAATLDRLTAIGSAYDQDPSQPIAIPASDHLGRATAPPEDGGTLVRPASGDAPGDTGSLVRPADS